MIDMSPNIVVLVLLGGILLLVVSGYYLGAMIGAVAVWVCFLVGILDVGGDILYLRLYDLAQNYSFMALPLFIFMGLVLERTGLVEGLYRALFLWLGGYRGGLAVATVLVGTVLAACVGIVAAGVVMLSIVALPEMIKRGYDKELACGVCAVSGSLGILIPPSINLVMVGAVGNMSIGKLFFAAFVPGFLLAGLYITYITIRCFAQPRLAPIVSAEERAIPFLKKASMLIVAAGPPLFIIMSVLGVIFFGIAPPTEAAASGAFASILLAIAYRRFTFTALKESIYETLKLFGFIFFIAGLAYAFVGVFLHLGGGKAIQELLLSAPGGAWGAFAAVMIVVFILGFFFESFGIIVIVIPIIIPIVPALGFDPIWISIMICVNLQMGHNTPPFAPALYFEVGAADPELGITIVDAIKGVFPFIILIMTGIVICSLFPQLVLWLPSLMIGQ